MTHLTKEEMAKKIAEANYSKDEKETEEKEIENEVSEMENDSENAEENNVASSDEVSKTNSTSTTNNFSKKNITSTKNNISTKNQKTEIRENAQHNQNEQKNTLFEELQDLMVEYRFRPEKKLSQFFCINEALLQFVANSTNLKKTDVVIEVGPGTGFLTRILLKKCKVIAIEPSRDMCSLLELKFASEIAAKKLILIKDDALSVDFDELFKKYGANKFASLPPYHISSELLLKLSTSKNIETAVLVLDTGFVNKLTAFEGLMEYSVISVLANLNGEVEVLEPNISSQSFFPAPNCISAVVRIKFEHHEISKEFVSFLKELFRLKNKDLSNGIKKASRFFEKAFKLDSKKLFERAKKIEILEFKNKKIYQLAPEEFLELFDLMKGTRK